ncbi:MAG TPA: hypothetical protein VH539_15565 [Gemmatimonadaceae bacterium]|jgi:hypothetical protein
MTLNWPAVGLILGVVAILVFRRALTSLLERTEKVKDWLVAPKQPALPEPANKPLPTRDTAEEQRALEELTTGFDNQSLRLQEDWIRADLTKHGLTADGATEKVLLRHLAGTQLVLHLERIYYSIYSSQLQALRWLNSQGTGVSADSLVGFYDRAVSAWPAIYQDRDFRSWLAFLASQGLITESEESKNAPQDADPFGLKISVLGREFLAFLVNAGRADPFIG